MESKFGYISCDKCNKKLYRTKKKIEQGEEVKLSNMMRVGKGKKFNKIADIECDKCGGISFKLVRE
jgi:ribosomal protein L37E